MARVTMRTSTTRRLLSLQLMLIVLLFSLPSESLVAQSFGERRVHVGLKLFRTLVAADTASAAKLDANGRLPVHLVYADNARDAREYALELAADMDSVRGAEVRIEVVSLADLLSGGGIRPAAIFVTQPLDDRELARLVGYAIRQHAILFSPFEGDVEKGVLGGISVEATIRPLINMRTLRASELAIKSFYLRVAKRYGDGEN
ncbi:MAG: hypothetical protein H6945_07890 [Zoogloeaceae bacterium]|nr:hypothetical protein [Rhodocyclaceae bacterium]MCP5235645.1 hypothetical protein [Zoogloeaceae bacterium]